MMECDWIFGGGVIIVLLLLAILPCLGGKLPCKDKNNEQVTFCIKKRNMFIKVSMIWYVVYYSVTLGSILATVIVIYLSNFEEPDSVRIFVYSVISLFLTIVNFVLNPREVASVSRKCFNKLDRAIANNCNEDNKLMETVYCCEEMITDVLK